MKNHRGVLILLAVLIASLSLTVFAQATSVQTPCNTALININLDSITVAFAGTGGPFPPAWRTADDRDVIAANAELIPAARDAGILIIYLYGSYDNLQEGEELASYVDEIAPQEGDILIGRPGPNLNVFTDTILMETLQERGIENLIFSGLNTGYCVNYSSRHGLRFGFNVTIVANAHSGGSPEYTQSYNDWWPTLGISVVPFAELDFDVLCQSSDDAGAAAEAGS